MVAKAQYLYSNFATFTCFSDEKACKGTTIFGHTQIFCTFFCIFEKKVVLLQPIYEHSHSVIFIRGAVAFGIKCAIVHTALLNGRAT
jgi:hypothetical protein